eukprot:2549822-Alexandrium_andersonii.AAC.1
MLPSLPCAEAGWTDVLLVFLPGCAMEDGGGCEQATKLKAVQAMAIVTSAWCQGIKGLTSDLKSWLILMKQPAHCLNLRCQPPA